MSSFLYDVLLVCCGVWSVCLLRCTAVLRVVLSRDWSVTGSFAVRTTRTTQIPATTVKHSNGLVRMHLRLAANIARVFPVNPFAGSGLYLGHLEISVISG